ncbi:nucleoside phosphorylase domain-containing protein [Trichoderma velutinum]
MATPKDYTVAWICSTHMEYVAAKAFLDKTHEEILDETNEEALDEAHDKSVEPVPHDRITYTLGRIGRKHVVIVLPPPGEHDLPYKKHAVEYMTERFPTLKGGLTVGVGGAAPSQEHDIRLGDVVVGTTPDDMDGDIIVDPPHKTVGGRPTAATNILRAAQQKLSSDYDRVGNQIRNAVDKALASDQRLRQDYSWPGAAADRLYRPQTVHPSNDKTGCAVACGDDPNKLVMRPIRGEDEDDPAVHHGIIYSGDTPIRNATDRDEIRAKHNVLCFEVGAVGFLQKLPCLVIRGICSYSDSHANEEWRGYAAMTAAAYAKDLLSR